MTRSWPWHAAHLSKLKAGKGSRVGEEWCSGDDMTVASICGYFHSRMSLAAYLYGWRTLRFPPFVRRQLRPHTPHANNESPNELRSSATTVLESSLRLRSPNRGPAYKVRGNPPMRSESECHTDFAPPPPDWYRHHASNPSVRLRNTYCNRSITLELGELTQHET